MSRHDVAIVGLGAMGSAAAWVLSRRGVRVLGIDRYTPPHHFGSTHGQSRIIREAYYEHPLYVPLVQRAYTLWDDLSQESGRQLLVRTGGLMIGPADGTLVQGAQQSARLHQLPCALWSGAKVRDRVPALNVPDSHVALWEPRAGLLRPEQAVDAMLTASRRHGAELVFNTAVTGWRPDGDGFVVATRARDYRASRVVLSAGPWIGQLLPRAGVPFTVERAVQCWFRPATRPELFAPDRLPVFIVEWARNRFFYGLPDHGAGVKLAEHHAGEVTTADTVRRLVDEREWADVRALALQWMPGVAGALADASVCLYTNTPDGHFVIDRLPEHPGVIVASPCSGHGFKFAPAIGEILADLATGATPGFDLSPFRLSRF